MMTIIIVLQGRVGEEKKMKLDSVPLNCNRELEREKRKKKDQQVRPNSH